MIGAFSSLGSHQLGISISGAGPSGVGGFGGGTTGRGLVGRGVPAVGNGLDGRKFGEAYKFQFISQFVFVFQLFKHI